MAEPEPSARRGWVEDAWYAIEDAARVGRAPRGVTRFGQRLVLFRDERGALRCTGARCPHRGADLAEGRVVGGQLECPYHGFRFDGDGHCTATPCEGKERKIPARLVIPSHHVREAHGFVWMWRGDPARATEIPWFPQLPDTPARSAFDSMEWDATLARAMESVLDIHHFPFAHRRVGGSLAGTWLDPYEARVEDGVIYTRGVLRKDDGTEYDGKSGSRFFIHARFPSQVHLGVAESMPAFVAVTPIDERRTWIGARYWIDVPVVGSLLAWLAVRVEMDWVQPEDRRIAEGSLPAVPTLSDMCPVRADAGIVLWHRLAHAAEKKHRRLDRAPAGGLMIETRKPITPSPSTSNAREVP